MFKRSNAKLDRLKTIPLLENCGTKELRAVSENAEVVTYDAGTVLIEEGSLSNSVFVIVEGTAVVTKDDETLATVGSGTVLGEAALLDYWVPPSGEKPKYDSGRRTATVTVSDDGPLEALTIEPRNFETLRNDAPAVAQRLLSGLNERFQEEG